MKPLWRANNTPRCSGTPTPRAAPPNSSATGARSWKPTLSLRPGAWLTGLGRIFTRGPRVDPEKPDLGLRAQLDAYRRSAYHVRFLDQLLASSPSPDVVWDAGAIGRSVSALSSDANATPQAQRLVSQVCARSTDGDLRLDLPARAATRNDASASAAVAALGVAIRPMMRHASRPRADPARFSAIPARMPRSLPRSSASSSSNWTAFPKTFSNASCPASIPSRTRARCPGSTASSRRAARVLDNFYVRAISLSTPSWSLLDTGQHLQIHGNAEFDRYTGHVYDYMNFFPFYVGYARSHKVDMPGVEVLDDQKIPLLIDRFPYPAVYQSFQLYQRGVRWKTLQDALPHHFSRGFRELLDEWTIGFELGSSVEEQTERELIAKLSDPSIQYLDYFTGDFDHVAHAASDLVSQRLALQRIDALIGRVWTAIQSSPLAAQTVLVAVSDHGMNTQPGLYSQGYNLLHFFNSRAGGAHHVVTNRHPLDEFKLRGLDPFVSEVVTPSDESLYLKGEADDYPTALLDLDGNERASVYLRNSAFNMLHILVKQINRSGIDPSIRRAAIAAFFKVIDAHRAEWQATLQQISEELGRGSPRHGRSNAPASSPSLRNGRQSSATPVWTRPRGAWRCNWIPGATRSALIRPTPALSPSCSLWSQTSSIATGSAAEELIPKRAMGDPNSVDDLENYVVGPSASGLVLAPDGSLDFARSFERINYPPLLASLSVRNNVQAAVGSHPVDFLAMRHFGRFASGCTPSEDKQALIRSRGDELRYLPVHATSKPVAFDRPGLPLRMFEDENLAVPRRRS